MSVVPNFIEVTMIRWNPIISPSIGDLNMAVDSLSFSTQILETNPPFAKSSPLFLSHFKTLCFTAYGVPLLYYKHKNGFNHD